jgi:hypothetical protein
VTTGFSTFLVESSRHDCHAPPFQSYADHHSEPARKTDRHEFGMLIDITSES